MKRYKSYRDLLNEFLVLNEENFDFLEVKFDDEIVIFLVEEFTPPIGGSVQTAPYLQFKGAVVDNFFSNSIYSLNDKLNYVNKFKGHNFDKEMISIQLSDNHLWRFYTK
jgi:hypothetical protein